MATAHTLLHHTVGLNIYVWITQATTDLLTAHSAVFSSLGMNLFKGFALILIVWTGCQIALGSASGASVRFDKFAGLLMSIAFVYGMLVYYDNPLPGIGLSFHSLITDQGANLAGQIEAASTEEIGKKLADVYDKMEQPSGRSILDVMQVVRYYGIVVALSFAQAAVLAVISFGFVAVGVCVLVGPIFIPFFLVPHMEWMFWGWFKTLVQYAFYPVIGNAFVYVYGKLFLNFFDLHKPPYNASVIAGLFLHLAFICIAFVWGIFKVPSLVSSIFRADPAITRFLESVGGGKRAMASRTQLLPPPAKDFNDAKRLYMEQFGSALVTNMYLRVAVLCLSVVAAGALVLNFRTYSLFQHFKPLVIRINDVGRAEPVEYASLEYKPQAPEIKYFLTQFVHDYYSRNRATVRNDFARSLFFLDSGLAAARMDQDRKTKEIETFMVEGNEEVEVHVENIVLQDLRTPPFRAMVDFEKVYLSGRDRMEIRRETYVASFQFIFKDTVSNNMIPVNPLGLTITYFRDDQSFQEVKP